MTKKYTIQTLTKNDKKALLRFYKRCQYTAGFMGHDHCYYILNEALNIVASVIVSFGQNNLQQGLIHGLVTDKNHQKQGLATALIQHCQHLHTNLVCFTFPELTHFYRQQGFKVSTEDHIASNHLSRFRSYVKNKPTLLALISHKAEYQPECKSEYK